MIRYGLAKIDSYASVMALSDGIHLIYLNGSIQKAPKPASTYSFQPFESTDFGMNRTHDKNLLFQFYLQKVILSSNHKTEMSSYYHQLDSWLYFLANADSQEDRLFAEKEVKRLRYLVYEG